MSNKVHTTQATVNIITVKEVNEKSMCDSDVIPGSFSLNSRARNLMWLHDCNPGSTSRVSPVDDDKNLGLLHPCEVVLKF